MNEYTLLQLSDLHLRANPDERIKGVPPFMTLEEILVFVEEGIASGRWSNPKIVFSGDLADDEKRETYQQLKDRIGKRLSDCYFLPGNHDDRQSIRETFPTRCDAELPFLGFRFDLGEWTILGLDTQDTGRVTGWVEDEQLDWMRSVLTNGSGPVLVVMHHPPFRIGADWIDDLGLSNGPEVLQLLTDSPRVKVVTCGHVHQVFTGRSENAELFTAPSTCVQFKPGPERAVGDLLPPGFRSFRLHGDELVAEVVRLPRLTHPPLPKDAPQ